MLFRSSFLENHKKGFYIISYIGSLPADFYNLNQIEDILYEFIKKNSNYLLLFVGIKYRFKKLKKYENKNVLYLPRVTRRMAIIYTILSNYSLFFGHNFDGYLTTKLFELIKLNKNIIPIGLNLNYEASKIIQN